MEMTIRLLDYINYTCTIFSFHTEIYQNIFAITNNRSYFREPLAKSDAKPVISLYIGETYSDIDDRDIKDENMDDPHRHYVRLLSLRMLFYTIIISLRMVFYTIIISQ